MRTLVGFLAEAKIPGTFDHVWVRIGLAASREGADELHGEPIPGDPAILETRVTPYYRISAGGVVAEVASMSLPKQPVRRPKLAASALATVC